MNRIVQILVPAVCFAILAGAGMAANAQFKEVGPPPFSQTVARQKIGTLLESVDSSDRQQTIDTLTGLLVWYRDILDEELISGWKKDERARLTPLLDALADARVASAIVEFSWRQQREATFNLTYAPIFGTLMLRFPDSAKPFLDDLLGPAAPELSQPEAETVCRILLDMPEIGTWKQNALQILPHYRKTAENLLVQDLHGSDQEKSYRAQLWLADLKSDAGGAASGGNPRRAAGNRTSVAVAPRYGSDPASERALPTSAPARAPLSAPPAPSSPLPYDGPKSGTLECSGGPIPQNAEYVFRNLPPAKIHLDYDAAKWDARLAPGEGQTQRLILRNKSSGPQKRCVVRWSVIP
jgi:hypothetical protein